GFPGLAKTLLVNSLSCVLGLKFNRIQCTPDLMPSDITGTYIIDEQEGSKSFRFVHGPVFTNMLLADEINRATPKTQSALLEAMQERQVTSGGKTYPLEKPFMVLATQNPIEMEGTYPLPEAQVDRFLLKILVDYPTPEEEEEIVEMYAKAEPPSSCLTPLWSGGGEVDSRTSLIAMKNLMAIQKLTRLMPISQDIRKHALNIVFNTRPKSGGSAAEHLDYGASPRASIGLVLAAKANALISGRNYVSKKDVEEMAYPVLRHRLILSFESERKGLTTDDVIQEILGEV
ncbi:MAG TPA: AAA family ATPase, partial [Candidatus Altiarchaeales archaeon]|nr:AAA family ATPase [Candidatus Altiarchaeales archaeon]